MNAKVYKKKMAKTTKRTQAAEKKVTIALYVLIALGVIVLGISLSSLMKNTDVSSQDQHDEMTSSLSFTSFDKELARKLMDKDKDGKCDVCGMPVEMCISTGQMECTMTGGGGIGLLDSDHIHADWKIFINGKQLDLSDKAHMARMNSNKPVSSFIHVDSGSPSPEQIGDVLHMHAKNVPLWVFFESVGMELTKDCLTLETGEKYCNGTKHSLKMFVNGAENIGFGNYVFKDLDKMLITYGDDEAIPQQLASITDFAKDH